MPYNFDKIAPSYDRLNHLMTLGLDRRWRKLAARELSACHLSGPPTSCGQSGAPTSSWASSSCPPFPSPTGPRVPPWEILDVACGTGDLSLELLNRGFSVTGIDLSEEMLEIAKQKTASWYAGVPARDNSQFSIFNFQFPKTASANSQFSIFNFQLGNAEALPFPDASFDAVTCAFGVRNFAHLDKGLEEMTRVLKPGGRMVILELSTPDNPLIRPFYNLYTQKIIPLLGQKIAGNREAYTYLPDSISRFPKGNDFLSILLNPKFKLHSPHHRKLFFGVARLYTCTKS